MGRVFDSALRWLARSGFRHGMSGDHWAWFLIAGAAFLLRRTRRLDDKVARIHLRPGDRYTIVVRGGDGEGRSGRRGSGSRREREIGRPRVVWHGDRVTTAIDHAE